MLSQIIILKMFFPGLTFLLTAHWLEPGHITRFFVVNTYYFWYKWMTAWDLLPPKQDAKITANNTKKTVVESQGIQEDKVAVEASGM